MFFSLAYTATAFLALCTVSTIAVPHRRESHWVPLWVSMPQLVEPGNLPPPPFAGPSPLFNNVSLRQTLYLTQPASQLRLTVSNAFGIVPLTVNAATIALPANGVAGVNSVQAESLKKVTFLNGAKTVTIAPGALAVSDPVDIAVKSQQNVAVTLYFATGQTGGAITGHPGSRTTSWLASGDLTSAATITGGVSTDHWYFLSAIEGWVDASVKALLVVGDSITDGRGSDTNGNNRWPDQLLARLQNSSSTAALKSIAIGNQAAGGNRVLADGLGPSALSRLDRDVLKQNGVGWVLLFEGVNDIGVASADSSSQQQIGDQLLAAYQQIITKVHATGLPIFGATITPMKGNGYYDGAGVREKTRQRVNKWIRESGKFDGVMDFDMYVRDAADAAKLDVRWDVGDGLHLSVKGYGQMAQQFPVELLKTASVHNYV